ncbi:oxalate/formate MFS antiporter [Pseudomonas agarici]|uniref:Oxalate/formate MFS antiporter n=1 Tax=Pseudomonas agarici TaxID=46677 RepID=A0A0X1T4L2_PSEAA|nr:oxalate/formate MFS antiporter [Pseudomonas agarici]AMB86961.1 oxalate/formate MFS antiporter [Pseudomonas agarici]
MSSKGGIPTGFNLGNRWIQLLLAIICMGLVANVQYSWTLFVRPIHETTGWSELSIQVAFTLFIMAETWLVPLEGMLVDRFGPRPVIAGGALLIMIAWVLNAYTSSLYMLYLDSLLAGTGAGCVYGTCVGIALKWFPDRRGFAGGLAAAGFGVGAALTIIPIANEITLSGYQHAFLKFGLLLGGAVFLVSMLMIKPVKSDRVAKSARNVQGKRDYTTVQMMKTPVFWVSYLIFTAMSAGGLIATAQIASIARDFGIASIPMSIFQTVIPLLTLTLSIDNLVNGLTRPLCGLLSDRFGRENTMFFVFLGEGLALLGIIKFGHNPYLFLIFAPLIYLCWGEIYAISSAMIGDTYGSRNATANAGALFTTKGFAALIVPFGSLLREITGTWDAVFVFCSIIAVLSAIASRFVLAPMRRNFIITSNAEYDANPPVDSRETSHAASPISGATISAR